LCFFNFDVESKDNKRRLMPVMQPARFNVIVQKEDTWYVAKCIDNSVASQGRTIEEALDNLKEALVLYYEDEPLYDLPVPAMLTSMEVAV
jgi:predicted RNase H-like HicB family nuclease